jgi:chromosome partitioning protein
MLRGWRSHCTLFPEIPPDKVGFASDRRPAEFGIECRTISVIIAVLNNKGGVGKTTASVNLGAALAGPKRRVLLADLDSQASASLWCGVDRKHLLPSSADCLLHNYPVAQAIRHTPTRCLDLITGSAELANADLALCDVVGRELTLKQALQPVRSRYDIIILDCPPSLSLIGVNALVAADAIVVPVTPQFLAIEGLVSLLSAVEQVKTRLGSRARLLGILLTMVTPTRAAMAACDHLRSQYREKVFHTEITASRALEEAPAEGKSIFQFAPKTRAADAFQRLAGEVLERARNGKFRQAVEGGTIRAK